MHEKPVDMTASSPCGNQGKPGTDEPGVRAEVLQFPDLLGERRKASCDVIRDELDMLPELRMEKIQDALEKIRGRFYESPEVLEAILRRLLADVREPR